MGSGEASKIEKTVDLLLSKMAGVTDDSDWVEADGWVGKWIITGDGGMEKVYEIRGGKFHTTYERDPREYRAEVTMSVDTFLDLAAAALDGNGEDVFMKKFRNSAIRYRGDSWMADSERFRKLFQRLRSIRTVGGLLKK